MSETGRVYRLTAIRAADAIKIRGFSASWFDSFEEVTVVTDLRIQFKIEKHRKQQPNSAEIMITNLAAETRDAFARVPLRVRLEAGYDNTPRLLFVGDLRHGRSEKVGTEWLTKLQLADGGRAYAAARAIPRSYAKGTPIATILADLAKALGVSLPAEVTAAEEFRARIPTGEVLSSYAADELTRILAAQGFEWSFQNERLQILRFDAPRPGTVRLIAPPPDGGMIGAPVITPPKITAGTKRPSKKPHVPKLVAKHTLYPELTAAERIQVEAVSASGLYTIEKLTHEGDNWGDEWTTSIEAVAA